MPEKLKFNSDTETEKDYLRHIYNGNGIEGTCDVMPNIKLFFTCTAGISYRDDQDIDELIFQKQGIFMFGDKDFKRETGEIYTGNLVVQIRNLDKDINLLIDLLLSDETIDITLVSHHNKLIENIIFSKNLFF